MHIIKGKLGISDELAGESPCLFHTTDILFSSAYIPRYTQRISELVVSRNTFIM